MANSIFTRFQRWYRQRLTLRLRLAFWSGLAIFIISVILILFINVTASKTVPAFEGRSGLRPATAGAQTPGNRVSANSSVPDHAVQSETVTYQVDILNQVMLISLAGLGLATVLGGFAAYWVTGLALRPVNTVSAAAQQISARSLDKRLAIVGPDDELKKLADAFDTMLDRLQGAFEQQSNFAADAAHELRTPLATLRTNLEVIQSDSGATVADYREMAQTFERSLSRMERLVEDLLFLAQGETGINFQEIALGDLIEELVIELTPLAEGKSISLQFTSKSEVVVRGDPTLLRRAISNLIENGIYYNSPGGIVHIDLEPMEKGIDLRVADTGDGIPPESVDHIFDRFYRGDNSRSRRKGGAGLGLSIAAHIVALHGGKIQVESSLETGSTFTISLPL